VKQIKTKKKPETILTLADGREGVRRFRTDVWMDFRTRDPALRHIAGPGFPHTENGSVDRAAKAIMKGYAARIACYDRVEGKYLWCVERGEKVPGTPIYSPVVYKGFPR
jgi:hypothetical protein